MKGQTSHGEQVATSNSNPFTPSWGGEESGRATALHAIRAGPSYPEGLFPSHHRGALLASTDRATRAHSYAKFSSSATLPKTLGTLQIRIRKDFRPDQMQGHQGPEREIQGADSSRLSSCGVIGETCESHAIPIPSTVVPHDSGGAFAPSTWAAVATLPPSPERPFVRQRV